jgi:type II secretory pathway component PulK
VNILFARIQINKGSQRAVILILTLWIAVVLSMIAYSLAYEIQMEMKVTKLAKDDLGAYGLAKAGIAKAIADLKNDLLLDHSEKAQIFDAEGDVWAKPEEGKTKVELGSGMFSVRVVDEESKIDINTANHAVLKELIKQLGYEEEYASTVASAIIDWRDPDDSPSVRSEQKEDITYALLRAQDQGLDVRTEDIDLVEPYHCKNDQFTSIEELLNVYGVTPAMFYGLDETDPEMQKKRKKKLLDTPIGLKDLVTVDSIGHLNVNTASEVVLAALLSASAISESDSRDVAAEIVKFRRGGRHENIDNDKAFRNIGDLSQVESLNPPLLSRMQHNYRLATSSRTFKITSAGTTGRAQHTIEATVVRTWEVFQRDEKEDDRSARKTIPQRPRTGRDKQDERVVQEPTIRFIRWVEL